jgi:hypothetical protein
MTGVPMLRTTGTIPEDTRNNEMMIMKDYEKTRLADDPN